MTKSRIALLLVAAAAWGQLPIPPTGELSAQARGIGNCPPVAQANGIGTCPPVTARGQLPITPAGECSAQAEGIGNCPHTAEKALAAGQAVVRETVRPDCTRGEEEIVVCGRRDESERHRLPLRVEPEPRAADRAGGEQMAAVRVDTSRCTTVGQNQQCSGGWPVAPIVFWVLQKVAKAVSGED